jgi:hypothetical protein
MFLLVQLRRLDVWPPGDVGVRVGYGLAWATPTASAKELEALGDPYRPHRSVLAWYCWPAELYTAAYSALAARSGAQARRRSAPRLRADRPGGGESGLHLLTPRAALDAPRPRIRPAA